MECPTFENENAGIFGEKISVFCKKRMSMNQVARGILVVVLFTVMSTAQTTTPVEYVVVRPVVNMFRTPSLDADVVSQSLYGTNVTLIKAVGNWMQIRTADDYTGWVQIEGLRKLAGKRYADGVEFVKVSESSANVYREPDVTAHAPLLNLPWESRLEVINAKVDERGRWLRVRLADGGEGFIQRGDVSSDASTLDIPQTIALAKRFMGVTYTWGGTSSFGFDCSGFVQMLVRQRGVTLPRDASLQANWNGLLKVERKDLVAGDLLYFGEDLTKVTHTGMYIGNGEFIHDTTHERPMVQISRLNDEPWTKLLVAARRVKQ
jgi:cell wall-associated NlpC family hydrolase